MSVTFIRYNPDRYIDNLGKKIDARNKSTRHKILTETIDSVILHAPKNTFEVIYLFYDGYSANNHKKEIININQFFKSENITRQFPTTGEVLELTRNVEACDIQDTSQG